MLCRSESRHHGDFLWSSQGCPWSESLGIECFQGRMCHPVNGSPVATLSFFDGFYRLFVYPLICFLSVAPFGTIHDELQTSQTECNWSLLWCQLFSLFVWLFTFFSSLYILCCIFFPNYVRLRFWKRRTDPAWNGLRQSRFTQLNLSTAGYHVSGSMAEDQENQLYLLLLLDLQMCTIYQFMTLILDSSCIA